MSHQSENAISELCDTLHDQNQEIECLVQSVDGAKLYALISDRNHTREQIELASRQFAVKYKTVVLHDRNGVKVQVVCKAPKKTYDVEQLLATLPTSVLRDVLVVDCKKLAEYEERAQATVPHDGFKKEEKPSVVIACAGEILR